MDSSHSKSHEHVEACRGRVGRARTERAPASAPFLRKSLLVNLLGVKVRAPTPPSLHHVTSHHEMAPTCSSECVEHVVRFARDEVQQGMSNGLSKSGLRCTLNLERL